MLVVVDGGKAERKRTQEPARPLRVSQWGIIPMLLREDRLLEMPKEEATTAPPGDRRRYPSPRANPSGLHGQLGGCMASQKGYMRPARGLHYLPAVAAFETPFSPMS